MSGAISIPNYPAANLVPGYYFSVDTTQANTASVVQRALLVGQMTAAGMATPLEPVIMSSANNASTLFGPNSQLALMVARYRGIDTYGEVWALPLQDSAAAEAASGSITIAGTAAAAGTLSLYLDDQIVPVLVNGGDTATVITGNVAAAIVAAGSVPFNATAANGTVTLTAVNKGLASNDLLVYLNFQGASAGEITPTGLTVTITLPTGGTQNPTTIATTLANLGDKAFDFVAHPYNDPTSLAAFKAFFSDTSGRWSPLENIFGHGFTALRGTLGTVTAATPANDKHGTIVPIADSPASPKLWAAEVAAQVAVSARNNPAIPITQVPLVVRPPQLASRFTISERQSLLVDGYGTYTVDDSGTVQLERLVTTYTTNASGLPDNSFQDVELPYTLMACIRDLKTWLASQFSRFILVANGSQIPGGAPVTTAALILASVCSRYRYQANTQFWAQNPDTFAANAQATNAGNGVVQLLLPYQVADQLWIIAANVQLQPS